MQPVTIPSRDMCKMTDNRVRVVLEAKLCVIINETISTVGCQFQTVIFSKELENCFSYYMFMLVVTLLRFACCKETSTKRHHRDFTHYLTTNVFHNQAIVLVTYKAIV